MSFFDYYRLGTGWRECVFVLHFQRDNYRLKLPSPRSHSVLLFRASMRGVMLASPRFSELVGPKALPSVTERLFNLQRQSPKLASHSRSVVTQKTESVKTIARQNGLSDYSSKPHAFRLRFLTRPHGMWVPSGSPVAIRWEKDRRFQP